MEWSNEATLEFLSLYEKEQLIWNPKDPAHKNRNFVSDAWIRIKNKMSIECSVHDLERKKRFLNGNVSTTFPQSEKQGQSQPTYSNQIGFSMNIWLNFCMEFTSQKLQ